MLLTLLLGCPFVTPADLKEIRDSDGDGSASVQFGGPDCDDSDPNVFPHAPDAWYDGVDSNCDGADDYDQDGDGIPLGPDCDDEDPTVGGQADWYLDLDGDGLGGPEPTFFGCGGAELVQLGTDCDDYDATVGSSLAWYADDDGDGFGDPQRRLDACAPPTGWVADDTDCDDGDPERHPGQTWHYDHDGDQFGDPDDTVEACLPPVGAVLDGSDCDDTDGLVYPGALHEKPHDGHDQDCAGDTELDEDGDGWVDLARTDCSAAARRLIDASAYTTLQDAVDDAETCDVIQIPAGTWTGGVRIDSKSIALVGAPHARPILQSSGAGAIGIQLAETDGKLASLTLENLEIDGFDTAVSLTGNVNVLASGLVIGQGVAFHSDAQSGASTFTAYDSQFLDTFDVLTTASNTMVDVKLERCAIEDAQSPKDLLQGGLSSTTLIDTTFHDCAALRDVIHVPSGQIDFEGLRIEDVFGTAISAALLNGPPSTMTNVTVTGSATTSDHLILIDSGYDPAPDLVVRDLEVSDSALEAPFVATFATESSSPTLAMVAFTRMGLDVARVRMKDDVVSRNGPLLSAIPAQGTTTLRNLDLEGDALAGVWTGPATIEQATFAGPTYPVWTSGDVSVEDSIFLLSVRPWTLPDYPWDLGTGSCTRCTFYLASNVPDGRGIVEGDPKLLRFDPSLPPALWDAQLAPGSPAIDAGDPTRLDPDGTRADRGAYGGPEAWVLHDDDGDGMYDDWELEWIGSTVDDGTGDPDLDGISTWDEYVAGTLPADSDTDDDGKPDGSDKAPLDPYN